ncbi:MAG: carboxypeptidase-like regulatory domain-containing protein [Bacteroidetes bacterium]|nr:carboxypeptidase-like regulatory domain-containing protein [Bacteroidota bacterium]
MKIFSLILILFTFTSFGQNISGKVLDNKNNLPIKNVNVYLTKTKEGTTTNKKGKFNLKFKSLAKPTDTITFSIIGYASKSFVLNELKINNNTIHLSEKIEELKEVLLNSDKKLKSKIHFNKLSSLKGGLHSFGSSLIENKIYVIGGDASYIEDTAKRNFYYYGDLDFEEFLKKLRVNFSWENYKGDLQIYDIFTDTWTMPDLKFRERAYNTINYYNNKIYVMGGTRLSRNRKFEYLDDKIEVFDIKTKSIIIDDTNPHQATNFASFIYDNNVIVMGGSVKLKNNGEKLFTNKSHIYNLESGYWYQLKDMPKAKEVKGVLIKNKIYLIGGFNNKPLKEIETYDITNGKWEKEGELFIGINHPALTAHNNLIYIFNDGKICTYNIDTKELNEYLIDLFLKSSSLFYYNDKLYLLGGFKEDEFSKTPTSKLYSINLNEFEKTAISKSKKL